MYTCDICQKQVKDLAGHKRRAHPLPAAEKAAAQNNQADNEDDNEDEGSNTLEVKAPPGAEGSPYHCVDCGGTITKGQAGCPHCGTGLDWSHVE